jgi:hypothetical protein
MPIYFLLSIWVLLSVGHEPTPQAYFERGALFYNALTIAQGRAGTMWLSRSLMSKRVPKRKRTSSGPLPTLTPNPTKKGLPGIFRRPSASKRVG